jgi:hypothetical protein
MMKRYCGCLFRFSHSFLNRMDYTNINGIPEYCDKDKIITRGIPQII